MRCPRVSLWGLLALALALPGARPVRFERARADARALTRTLSERLQQLQLFPLTLRVTGLEGVPEGAVPAGGVPEGGVPEGGVPEGAVPAGGVPEGGVPAGGVPEGAVPAGGVPEGGVPAGGVAPGLAWAAQRLQLFQRLLGALAGGDLRLAQVANDLENLRSVLALLGGLLGCAPPREPPPPPPAPLAEAPHTVAGVALARLRGCLEGVAACLEGVPAC